MAKTFFRPEPWSVSEDRFQPELNEFLETIFFLGNGYLGTRGFPEEGLAGGPSCPATYVASVYDFVKAGHDWRVAQDITHCSIMVESANWAGLRIRLGETVFDPRQGGVTGYRRTLDLRAGTLTRTLTWHDPSGRQTRLEFVRFVSMDDRHLAALSCRIRPLDWSGPVEIEAGLDAARAQQQSVSCAGAGRQGVHTLTLETSATHFVTTFAAAVRAGIEGGEGVARTEPVRRKSFVGRRLRVEVATGWTVRLDKVVAVCSSRDRDGGERLPRERAAAAAETAARAGFDALLERHRAAWERLWQETDIVIEGDDDAQQGVRFCVFNMHQNYAGGDPRVNIPAKGLTGPGYGGLYWWDTEAYMVPFFLYTAPEKARDLLLYRHFTLDGARHKARAYGYEGAMVPWVTIDGEERSGDFEYGMLEQHTGTAVAHAIREYVEATGDDDFLWEYGAELLIEIARFWASRVAWSPRRRQYVINFVTGPDEYAVAVNNNCYTNYTAKCALEYAAAAAQRMEVGQPARWQSLTARLALRPAEPARWREVAAGLYIPFNEELGIHEQDDTFLERTAFDRRLAAPDDLPAGRKWPWYRLMQSQAMKQADVVLLMFKRNDDFPPEVKRANFDFYEPKTTHESSLSPCIYSIMAAELGRRDAAFEYYLRSARLDLDDVNGNAHQGQHTASIAGSCLCVINGFGGLRVRRGTLTFSPCLPEGWRRLAFRVRFRGRTLHLEIEPAHMRIRLSGADLEIAVNGAPVALRAGEIRTLTLPPA